MVQNDLVIAMRRKGEGISNYGKPWTDEERRRLEKLFDEGVGITEIAILLERSETAVIQQLFYCRAFRNENKGRDRSANQCRCHRCDLKFDCQLSPQNRDKFLCLMEERNTHV